jgi:sulfoquinovosyltransferase
MKNCSFPFPWYQKVPLSLALSPRIISAVAQFKPDIIHASSPGIMVCLRFIPLSPQLLTSDRILKTYLTRTKFQVFGALIIAKLLSVPIVMSYHTHVPV